MPDDLTDPLQDNNPTPLPWQTVASDPAFKQAAPEDKLVAFSRWHDQAYNYAKTQPDWAANEANFNQSASEIQGDLSKAAGDITLDQAKIKIGEQAVAAAGATNGQQIRDALRPYGPDVWKSYLDNRKPEADETILANFNHELINAGREMEAHFAKSYANAEAFGKGALAGISDQVFGTNIAIPEKKPDVAAALTNYDQRIKNAQDTLTAMPHDHPDYERTKNEIAGLQADRQNFAGQQNAGAERFANAVADLHNTLANIDPEFHVDKTLKNTLSAKLGGVVGDIAPAFTPGVGVPILFVQSGLNAWGGKYDETGGDEAAANEELVKNVGINLAFMGLAHGANSLLGKALAKAEVPVGPVTGFGVRAVGGSAANAVIGQAISGAEAAANAPEGEKYAAFAKAFNTPDGSSLAQAIAFGILGAKPIESMKAAAAERLQARTPDQKEKVADTAATNAAVTNLEQANAPKTAEELQRQADLDQAVQGRANALRESLTPLTPEARAARLEAAQQRNFIEGTFPTEAPAPAETAPATAPAIKLTSSQSPEGDYSHNLVISPDATVEQLQAWKQKVDLSHLPVEARAAAIEQVDAAITDREAATSEKKAEPEPKAPGQEIRGPVLLAPDGKTILVQGEVGDTHAQLMDKGIKEAGDDLTKFDAVLDAQSNDAQHAFVDENGNILNREQAAQVAVKAGQAPEGTTSLHAQLLKPAAVSAVKGEAGFNIQREHPLLTPAGKQPSKAEAAKAAAVPRTPEEKVAQVEKGRTEQTELATETGIVPLQRELHTATGSAAEASKLGKELTAKLATEFPPETLPEGAKETTTKSKVTGDKLPSVIEDNGTVRPKFTNDPNITAQQIDLGQRVVIPDGVKINPAIKWTIDKTTGERYVESTDVKLPDGRVVNVDSPDQFSDAYREATAFEGRAQKALALDPETLQGVKDKIDRDMEAKGIDYDPLTLGEELAHDNPPLDAVLEEPPKEGEDIADVAAEPTDSKDAAGGLTKTVISNMEVLHRLGIGKVEGQKNPLQVALKQISSDLSLPAGARKLAKTLLRSKVDWSGVKLKLTDDPISDTAGRYRGGATVERATIELNRAARHQGGITASLLHEAVHHLTLRKLDPTYARTPFEQKAYESIEKHYQKALEHGFEKVNGRKGSAEELRKFAKAQGGDRRINAQTPSEFYGLHSLREFVAETLSSSHFQKFLSEIEGEGGVKGKVGNLLNAIRDSLKKFFAGEEVKKGSLMDNALDQSYKLLRDPQETQRIGMGGLSSNKREPLEPDLTKMTRMDLVSAFKDKFGEPPIVGMSTEELRQSLSPNPESPKKVSGTDVIPDRHYGWLDPAGKFHEATLYRHADEAQVIIESNPKLAQDFKSETQNNTKFLERSVQGHDLLNAEEYLLKKGYVRVAGGPGNTTTYIQGKPTQSQLAKLKDAAISKGVELIHEVATGKGRTLYSPTDAFKKAEAEPKPTLTHETDETGKTIHGLNIPEGISAENLRGALETIDKALISPEEKAKLTSQVSAKLETYKVDQAANRYAELQDQIASQPNGQPTPAQSAEMDRIKAAMPEVVEHPQVQRSAQALGIIPGYLDINDKLARTFSAGKNYFATSKPAGWWAAWYNAAENKAIIFATQKTNDIRGILREAMNRKNDAPNLKDILKGIVQGNRSSNKINELDERALTFVVESQNNPANLDVMRQKIKTALATPNDNGPAWTRKAQQALSDINHAEANYARLSIAADQYTKYMQDQVSLENSNGVATDYRKGYVPHLQEVDPNYDVLFGGSPGTGGTGFKKARAYDTFADSIANGVTPKSLNALEAMDNRLKRGMTTIGKQKWAEAGRSLIDPSTNSSVVTDVIIDKHPTTGESQTRAPLGYQLKLLGNRQIAVHNGYASLFDVFTKPSALRDTTLGNAALQTAGFVKHGLLLFDTFHLGRLAYYQMPLRGKSTFTKGMLALDYSDRELQNMERRGQLPQGITSADMIARKNTLQRMIDAGLNVGGVQEAINAGFTRKLPVVGDFNKFVFEQFQRGGMAESSLAEYDRQRSAFPELSDDEVARKVSKELNTRFGNLKKEGWLASDTLADLAQLVLLAPHWNEGLIKSEVGLVTQTGKAAKDLAIGYKDPVTQQRVRAFRAGSILKGSGTLLLGTLAMNQIINYITRGTPTWQNPEEGIGAKLSAWIPDKIGGGPGFLLNPFTLPAEITHQVLEQVEKGNNTIQAISKVAGYKLGPVARSLLTLKTGTDRFDRPLYSQTDVMKEMVSNFAPVPIFGSSVAAAVKSIGEGKVQEPFKGAIEKQLFSTAGIKVSGAPSDSARIGRLAKEYLHSIGADKNSRYTGSDYQNLRDAIQNNDPQRAQKEYEQLLKTKTAKQIDTHFRDQVKSTFTDSKKHEATFRDTLSPEQEKAYDRAIDARAKLRDAYFDLNLTAAESPR